MSFDEVLELLRVIWPLLLLQVGLMVWALVDVVRRRSTRTLSMPAWIIIILFVNFFGPIAYFLFGRAEQ